MSEVTPAWLRERPLPEGGSSKHSRGHVLVVGGSPATPGAAMLAGLAALRVGSGVLRLAVAASVAAAVGVTVPESGVTPLRLLDGAAPSGEELHDELESADAVLVGPGLDEPESAKVLLNTCLAGVGAKTAVVLDAFALGVLPDLGELPRDVRCVLTPNSTEAERLLGRAADDPRAGARAIADKFRATVSYQGYLAAPDQDVMSVGTGHAGLGTSGSGDVLAGAVAGVLARGVEPFEAACWATYLHAAAGDRLAARVGRLGFLARELVDELPLVLTELAA